MKEGEERSGEGRRRGGWDKRRREGRKERSGEGRRREWRSGEKRRRGGRGRSEEG